MFSGPTQALSVNDKYRYSILGSIGSDFKYDGKYEFLLEYPQLNGSNWWIQNKNPVLENEGTTAANGYTPVSVSWATHHFGGLVKSSQTTLTLLDGSAGNTEWFYSIGTREVTSWSTQNCPSPVNCFPGPNGSVNEVYLWLRVNSSFLAPSQNNVPVRMQSKLPILIHLFFIP